MQAQHVDDFIKVNTQMLISFYKLFVQGDVDKEKDK